MVRVVLTDVLRRALETVQQVAKEQIALVKSVDVGGATNADIEAKAGTISALAAAANSVDHAMETVNRAVSRNLPPTQEGTPDAV